MEKEEATQVAEEKQEHEAPSSEATTNSVEDRDEPVPHLHAKTFLVVFAVCLIYFAQLINVVGSGAVSLPYISRLHEKPLNII
jgi:hypothetical protein